MARNKKQQKRPEITPLFGELPIPKPAPPPAAAPMPGPPVDPITQRMGEDVVEREEVPPSPSRGERVPAERTKPLQGVSWLLGEPKKRPEWHPGQLALHVVPVSKLAGSTVAVWQVRRLEFDIHNHRLLVLARACAPSAFPLLERWIPYQEMVLLKVSGPLEWEPWPDDGGMPPEAAEAPGMVEAVAELQAYRRDLLLGPPQIWNPPLRSLWGSLEKLATGLPAADDPIGALMDRLGLDDPAPVETGAWQRWLAGVLSHLGARSEPIRRMFIECGLSGDVIQPLVAAVH